jgi:hypothetical protein
VSSTAVVAGAYGLRPSANSGETPALWALCAAVLAPRASTPTAIGRDDVGAAAVRLRDIAVKVTIANEAFETSRFERKRLDYDHPRSCAVCPDPSDREGQSLISWTHFDVRANAATVRCNPLTAIP